MCWSGSSIFIFGTVGPPGVDVGKGVFAERLEIAESGIPGVVGAAGVCCALLDIMAYSDSWYCAREVNTLILADIDSVVELAGLQSVEVSSHDHLYLISDPPYSI